MPRRHRGIRQPTQYNIFMKQYMHKIRTENPCVKQTDVMWMASVAFT